MNMKTILVSALALSGACAFGGGAEGLIVATVGYCRSADTKMSETNVVAQKLCKCDFLLNKDFKKNAKYYLCLFSASWCPPCRAEMPRIAKTYAKMLKDDPDIELIHFSRDQNDEKALAWAKEHNVKFPVVKPKGGNPLDLHSRGIPHLFIVKADGDIMTEGRPMKLFTEQELHELKIIVDKTNENATTGFKRNNVTCTSLAPQDKISVVEKLDQCDFLINNDFKKDAKYYLCLFSALWCPPRRREMSRIAKTYAGMLKDDPDIELIYFSYDHDDEMVLAWARAHDVKFPIVRDGNPLRLYWRTSGDYLFIVKADGTLLKEGPPKRLFTEEKLRRLMKGEPLSNVATINDIKWTYEIVDGAVALGEGTSRNGLAVSKNTAGAIRIPDTIDGLPVRSIDEYAFSGCSGLTSITIPESVTKIANYVFEGCRGLSSITIPSGVKEIGSESFSGCKELMSISVSAENGQYTSREGVLFDKGMRTLVRCPCGIRGTYTLPRGVMHIGWSAFSGCGGLSGVKVPNSVKSVGDYAFDRCQGLTKVTLGSGVKSIGSCAFRDCDGLVSIRIPKSVENIDHSAFIFCSGLKEFIVEPNNRKFTAVNGMLLSKDRSELLAGVDGDVIVPNGVKSIGSEAFCQYSGLTSVRLPNSVTDIGDYSFYSCVALTSMTIPAKVKSIGRNAFGECRSLTSVTMCGERPESPDDVFRSCGNLKSIHVSANAKSWKGMKEWQGIPLVFDLE